jgi:hypothetical protein
MYNSVDDFDLYSSIQSDKEYLTIKLIAIGFSLLLCTLILFLKRERNEIIIDDINSEKDDNV